MTTSARSASRSVTLPFPSSPHWAPTTTRPGIALAGVEARGGGGALRPVDERCAHVASHYGDSRAHLGETGHRAGPDLRAQLRAVGEVGRDDDRALLLPALVDDRVELLEDPLGALLGAEVVEVQEVNPRQPAEEVEVGAPGAVLVGGLDVREELRDRVDRDRPARLDRGLGDQHRQGRLASPDVPVEPEAASEV